MVVYGFYSLLAAAAVGLAALIHRSPRWRQALRPAAILWAATIVVFMWSVSQPNQLLSDFKKAYYPAGHLIWHDAASMYRDGEPMFVNLPLVAVMFSPLAVFSRRVAGGLYTGLGALSILASIAGLLALSRATGWRKAAIAALVLLNGPLYNSLREGNTTHFVLLALIGALACLEQGRQGRSGALLALSALIKPPLALLIGLFVWRPRWPLVQGWALTIMATVGLSVGLFGMALHHTWWRCCIAPYAQYPLGAFNVQSVDGFLVRLLISTDYLGSWFPVTAVGPVFFLAKALLLGVLLLGTFLLLQRAGPPATTTEMWLETTSLLVLALLISPISWSHYYLLLLIPMALLIGGRVPMPPGRGWAALFWASVVMVSLPVRRVPAGAWWCREAIGSLLVSHFFLGGVLLLGVLLAARQTRSTLSTRGAVDVH
jgi:hypothetical protein